MVRKIFIVFLMAPPLIGAAVTGTALPVLLLMVSLLFIALAQSSARGKHND